MSDMHDSIINIAQWLYIYVATELHPWIESKGGWPSFGTFSRSMTQLRGGNSPAEMNLPVNWKLLVACGALALGTAIATMQIFNAF